VRCAEARAQEMAGTAVQHRVPTACSKTVARFRNAQLRELAKAIGACTACTPDKTSGPPPQGRWRIPVQGPELEGQVTTATPFAPSGAEPGRLSGICSGLAGGHSVKERRRNGPHCWRIARGELWARNMPLSRAYLLIGPKSQSACGLDSRLACLWFRMRFACRVAGGMAAA
jgi:hypothetical protein